MIQTVLDLREQLNSLCWLIFGLALLWAPVMGAHKFMQVSPAAKVQLLIAPTIGSLILLSGSAQVAWLGFFGYNLLVIFEQSNRLKKR